MIDTSVMVAGLVTNHEFHDLARPHVAAAARSRVPGIVLAEAWAGLRRAPWNLDVRTVEAALAPWSDETRIVTTPTSAYSEVMRTGRSLKLGGNVHDLLIALTCRHHGLHAPAPHWVDAAPARLLRRYSMRRSGLDAARRRAGR